MQITKIELSSGEEYYCESTRDNVRHFMKNIKAIGKSIAKMTRINMGKDKYFAIPSTNDSFKIFS